MKRSLAWCAWPLIIAVSCKNSDSPGATDAALVDLSVEDAAADASVDGGAAGSLTLLAGGLGGAGHQDGTGTVALFADPVGIVSDASGNIYVTDSGNDTIRMITSAGVVTTLAGSPGVVGANDGTGVGAQFNAPYGIAIDSIGNLFVSDLGNGTIRKIAAGGVVSTFAGTASQLGTSADGDGAAAKFSAPRGIATDSADNVYVADSQIIRKITPSGTVSTFAGTIGQHGSQDGSGAAARFQALTGLGRGASNTLYAMDNDAIRQITSGQMVTTIAGSSGDQGNVNGSGIVARFSSSGSIVADASGNLFVADSLNNTIRKIDSSLAVTTFAGSSTQTGSDDGTGPSARFWFPSGIAVGSAGELVVVDSHNSAIRKISTVAAVTTVAGRPPVRGSSDGSGNAARFGYLWGVAADQNGNVFAVDQLSCTLRKITADGAVTTLAGSAGQCGPDDGTGAAAKFKSPSGVAVDSAGDIFVADSGNFALRKITAQGVVTTFAGSAGVFGHADGAGATATFSRLVGLGIDASDNLFAVDADNYTIRKISNAAVVSTFVGSAGLIGTTNGTGSAARFSTPSGLSVDHAGNVYVSDGNVIRTITQAGVVTTLAGSTTASGSLDAKGLSARFSGPLGTAATAIDELMVVDQENELIRKIGTDGSVTTVAGVAGLIGINLGPLPGGLSQATSIAALPNGNFVIADDTALVILALPN